MLIESVIGVKEWLAKIDRLNKALAIVIILALATIGFYLLGLPGIFLGVLVAVGMIDEFFGKKLAKEQKIRQVFFVPSAERCKIGWKTNYVRCVGRHFVDNPGTLTFF